MNESLPLEDSMRWRQYVGVIWLRKWSIMALALLGLMGAYLYTEQQPRMYTSTITVIATDPLARVGTSGAGQFGGLDTNAESSLVNAQPVSQCAYQILQNPAQNTLTADLAELCSNEALQKVTPPAELKKDLSVTVPPDSTLLRISDSERVPPEAQATAQAFAIAYRHYKLSQANAQLNAQRAPLQSRLETVNKSLEEVNVLIAEAIAEGEAGNTALSAHLQQRTLLEQEQNSIIQQLDLLSPAKIDPPKIPSPATRPILTSPNVKLNLAAGLFVGLMLGLGIAFLRDRLNDSLRGRGDLEGAAGAPVLAVIPQIPGWKKRQETKLVTLEQPNSAAAEAYRTLRTSILFGAAQRGQKVIMVTSPIAGEGKTTTAANLAVVLADAKKRVILLSADLRKPRLHRFFNMKNEKGLSNVLAGEVQPWEVLGNQQIDNLRIMTGGPVPPRPGELLQSEQMGELLRGLREVADFIIVDTPPVLLVADAPALAPMTDAVVLVADAEQTTRSSMSHTRDALEQVSAPVIGAVLNNFDPSKAQAYAYRGGYYYGYGGYGYRHGAYRDAYGMNGDEREGAARRGQPALLSRRRNWPGRS